MEQDVSPASLTGFTLDMNSTLLSLTYDDVLLASSLDPLLVNISGSNGATYALTGGNVSSPDGFVLSLKLTSFDTDQLRLNPNIATSISNTFLTTSIGYVRDFFGIGVIPANNFQATEFIQDEIPPQLLNYTLNITSAILRLYVDEILDPASYTPSGFTFQNSMNGSGTSYTLKSSTATLSSEPLSYIVEILLSDEDVNGLKMTVGVATDLNNTYLSITDGAIRDTGNNSIIPIPTSNAKPAADLEADMEPPFLNSVILDLREGALVFNFSEAVNSTGFLSLVQLYNGATVTADLVGATLDVPESTSLIRVVPSDDSLNDIKLDARIGTDVSNTYFTLQADQIRDFVGLELIGVPLINRRVDEVIDDVFGPVVVTSSFDLNSGILVLEMDEYVNITTLNLSTISIKNADTNITLATLAGSTTTSTSGRTINISVSSEDLNTINGDKTLRRISLDIADGLVEDILGNQFQATNDILIDMLVTDQQPPTLQSFSIDLNSGNLVLTFSEPVTADNFTLSAVTLHGAMGDVATGHTVLNGTFEVVGNTISVNVSEDDLNSIKALESVGVNETTSYITLMGGVVSDIGGNTITESSTVRASAVTKDIVPPRLLSFAFEYTRPGKGPVALVLRFDETVDVSSIDLNQLVFYEFANETGLSFTFSTSTLPETNDKIVSILLSNVDLNRLENFYPIGQVVSGTFLSLNSTSLSDTSGNPVDPILEQVTRPLVDLSPPALLNFTLNMQSGVLTFTFSQPVNVSTFNITRFSLQDHPTSPTDSYTFQFSGTLTQTNSTELRFEASSDDINGIKGVTNVATALDKTYAVLEDGLVEDENGLPSQAIPSQMALQAAELVIESDPPTLQFFTVDLNPGKPITLVFSETVLVSTIKYADIVLQNSALSPSVTFNFSTAVKPTANSHILELFFPFDVVDEILASNIATQRTNTFLSIAAGAVTDRDGNPIRATVQQAQSVQTDNTPPSVSTVVLNLNSGLFVVNFDETVIGATIDLNSFSLQNAAQNATTTYILQGSYIIAADDTSFFSVFLEDDDLNAIKSMDLCDTSADCYLGYAAGSFSDARLINTTGGSVLIGDFTQDMDQPMFVEFTSFRLDTGELTVEFSEPINASSFIPSGFTLKSLFSEESLSNLTLSGGRAVASGNEIVITLTETDFVTIVTDNNLCTWRGNCYLAISEGAVKDPADLSNVAVDNTPNSIVSNFIDDRTPPELVSFVLDMPSSMLELTFNEPVNPDTLVYTEITLQDGPSANESYTLTGGSTSSPKGNIIQVNLNPLDMNLLKNTTFVTTSNVVYISMLSNTITDLALNPNGIDEILRTNATRGVLLRDQTGPILSAFSLDLNSDTLVLTFNEPVDLASVDLTDFTITIQGSSGNILDGGSIIESTVDTVHTITVALETTDVIELKSASSSTTSLDNTRISFTSRALTDTSGNPAQPRTFFRAALVVGDTTLPELREFRLDMMEGTLNLTFSDVVDTSTFNPAAIVLQSAILRYVCVFVYMCIVYIYTCIFFYNMDT